MTALAPPVPLGGPGPGGGSGFADAVDALRTASSDRRLLRRVFGLFRPYRRQVAGVGVLILVTSGLGVVSPLLVRNVFDDGLFAPGGVDLTLVLQLCATMIAVTVLAAALGVWQSYLTSTVG